MASNKLYSTFVLLLSNAGIETRYLFESISVIYFRSLSVIPNLLASLKEIENLFTTFFVNFSFDPIDYSSNFLLYPKYY